VNLTMKDCQEYEVRIDEAKPCERTTKSGEIALGGLPVNDSGE